MILYILVTVSNSCENNKTNIGLCLFVWSCPVVSFLLHNQIFNKIKHITRFWLHWSHLIIRISLLSDWAINSFEITEGVTKIKETSHQIREQVLTDVCQVQKVVCKILFESDVLWSALVHWKVLHDIYVTGVPVWRRHNVETNTQHLLIRLIESIYSKTCIENDISVHQQQQGSNRPCVITQNISTVCG